MLVLKLIGGLLVVLAAALLLFTWWSSRPAFDETRDASASTQTVAPEDQALTFARAGDVLLRVTARTEDSVTGVDLTAALGADRTADLVALYGELGYDGLAAVAGASVTVPLAELGMPVDFHYPFVAVGTNYVEHAEEVYLDDPPFLFPKLAHATPWNAPVPFTARLDYEAELGMVPLADIDDPAADVAFGLVLVNDFTDRWTLIRQIDLGAPMGTTGFADAKGCEGCLPTGYLFVIPRDASFHEALGHELWVNDRLRQRFVAGEMILKIDATVRQAFEHGERPHHRAEDSVPLLPEGRIPAGTLILTGTAAGVIFKPANIWLQSVYLGRGDRVRTQAAHLGHLDNTIQ